MCGRFATTFGLGDAQLAFNLEAYADGVDEPRPNYNTAPTHNIAIIVERDRQEGDRPASGEWADGDEPETVRALEVAHWGLIPPWSKDGKDFMINARLETAAEKRSFAPGFKSRRCIVPATGYFEWKKTSSGKEPYFIHRADGEILAFAGIYGWWKSPDDEWVLSATILTTAAEGELAEIHDRVPVILEPEQFDGWLDPELKDPDEVQDISSVETPDLIYYRVRSDVGSIKNNAPENIEPLE